MKRLLDSDLSLEELKNALKKAGSKDDKKPCIFCIGIVLVLIAAAVGATIYFMNKKNQEDIEDDWDCDWEDDADDDYSDEDCDECCCTDKDVDKSVKVEKL